MDFCSIQALSSLISHPPYISLIPVARFVESCLLIWVCKNTSNLVMQCKLKLQPCPSHECVISTELGLTCMCINAFWIAACLFLSLHNCLSK